MEDGKAKLMRRFSFAIPTEEEAEAKLKESRKERHFYSLTEATLDPVDNVRRSCLHVYEQSTNVMILEPAIQAMASHWLGGEEDEDVTEGKGGTAMLQLPSWFREYHLEKSFKDSSPDVMALYVILVELLNFALIPGEPFEYRHLASSLAKVARESPHQLQPSFLRNVSREDLLAMLSCTYKSEKQGNEEEDLGLPMFDERLRMTRNFGHLMEECFDGSVLQLINSAENSATKLVDILTKDLPCLRDESIFKGHQVFFYKKAQAIVANLFGAFEGQGYGDFNDIASLTCPADHSIAAVLAGYGVLQFSPELESVLEDKEDILPYSEMEAELRASSIEAVRLLTLELNRRLHGTARLREIETYWLLLQDVEENVEEDLAALARTVSLFY